MNTARKTLSRIIHVWPKNWPGDRTTHFALTEEVAAEMAVSDSMARWSMCQWGNPGELVEVVTEDDETGERRELLVPAVYIGPKT